MLRGTPEHHAEEGFSLVEVVVALSLLALVAASSAVFFLRGTVAASEQERRQIATTLATQAVEASRSVRPDYLLTGRRSADVQAQWTRVAPVEASTTFPAWDSTAVPGATPTIALASTTRLSGETYAVDTLVGVCYRLRSQVNGQCTKGTGTDAQTTPNGYVKLYRVIVQVAWTPGGGSARCRGGACTYRTATLIDPTAELRWSVTSAPVVEPSTQPIDAQKGTATPKPLRTLVDAGNTDQNSRVWISTVNAGGGTFRLDGTAYDAATKRSGRELTYTPPLNTVGTFTARWFVRNYDGQSSKTVTLTVPVRPVAVNDVVSVTAAHLVPGGGNAIGIGNGNGNGGSSGSSAVTVDLVANDTPSTTATVEVTDPVRTSGTCTLTRVDAGRFSVSGATGSLLTSGQTCRWTYTLRGTGANSGLVSGAAQLTVNVL
ncbi:prepilin-type N-terminal cleavage/methylation domain-containing protein [Kineococcus indalonis]|uniref:prepilin-type N-terminal cleavage/methylation domain-containing protein n=1 Tax=Kineococcus indalonis TaxID=2696566 RepID=UPI00141339B3|nr:prepilin-type N-terminal cleavage/methylation domain-containing protein [Kineococcus indalonis]NAZ84616.1 prepilin-type N-terminal cleavage/methylation domain-containing protein [Kineococcus indalonis]